MDKAKRDFLIARLSAEPTPQIVDIEAFFDGNDDLGSIGCNLIEHPGIETFRSTLLGLTRRADVDAIYAQISELDPGEGCWPFTDTVLVVGAISPADVVTELSALEPDQVSPAEESGLSQSVVERIGQPVVVVWWD